jgi:serine/threonine-protein kinase
MLDKIGKYKISRKIGRGAMGEVFEAHDPVLNRKVAIKTISGDMGGDSSLRKRFEREAQSAAQLSHPNIITVYDFGQEHELLYMAMELLEGKDLKHAVAKGSISSLEQKIRILEQICDGMEVAHSQGIIHRDLKPANIHLQPDGQVKIMDFGLARLSGSEMTRTGMVMGTPNYMAPEQVRGERADSRSDIFALGCVFYEVLAGRKPFDADSMHAVLFKVMQEAPIPLRELARDVPVALIQVVERALAKDPALRFQNAGELRLALRAASEAVAAGRGFEPLPGLELPDPGALGAPVGLDGSVAGPAGGGSMWSGSSSGSSSGSGSGSGGASQRSRSGSGAVSQRSASVSLPGASSNAPWYFLAVLVTLAVAGVLYFALRGGGEGRPDPVRAQLADTQAGLGQRRLDAGEYRAALDNAGKALELVPGHAEAQAVRDAAQAIVDKVDAATAALATARSDGNAAAAATALWELMQADPDHAEVADLEPAGEAPFQSRVAEARAAMTRAREAASGASSLPAYREGVSLEQQAEEHIAARRFGSGVLDLLRSRDRFERARRSAR